jgi:hypothetical protein
LRLQAHGGSKPAKTGADNSNFLSHNRIKYNKW